MIGPWPRGREARDRRHERDQACRDYGNCATPDESRSRVSLTQAGIDARMTVVIAVILRVNAAWLIMGQVVPVGVAVVARIMDHAMIDIDPRRPGNEDRQGEKAKRTKAGAAHHREKLTSGYLGRASIYPEQHPSRR